jgi:hypothetical protein
VAAIATGRNRARLWRDSAGTKSPARNFSPFEGLPMKAYDEFTDELSGDGMIIIDGRDVAIVPYSLTLAPETGPFVAEGSITGPEPLLRKVKQASGVKLALQDGPVVTIRCEDGQQDSHGGTRWIRATGD